MNSEGTVGRLFNHRGHPKDNVQMVTVEVEGLLRVAVVTKNALRILTNSYTRLGEANLDWSG